MVDIKAKALGISVVELFGGPTRKDVRVYWSHCGTSRATSSELLGTRPLKTMEDIADLGREVVSQGFTALKTNIILPGEPASVYFTGFGGPPGTTDGTASNEMLPKGALGSGCSISAAISTGGMSRAVGRR